MPESLKEDNRPAQQWYWDDWFSAFDVRLCSLAARGLWIDMLGIMWKAEIRGTLTVNGRRINNKTLSKIVGDSMTNINKLLKELEENEVFSRLEDGTLICRRMFRESGRKEQISQIRSEAGKKGAESRWQRPKQKITNMAASSSSPSSTATSNNKRKKYIRKKKFTKEELRIFEEKFEKFWKKWPPEARAKKYYCERKFIALCKAGKLDEFIKTTYGYFDYLKAQKVYKKFNQTPMHLSTWLNNWEGDKEKYIDYKYKPPF